MKRIYTIIVAVLLTATLWAQSPEKMSYQAVIRNSSDQLVTNQQVGMQMSILQGSESGAPVYIETQTPTTNANGLVTIEIGTGTTTDNFSAINWANGPYFIKTETDPAGGTNYTITGTSQLLSVPYALYAEKTGIWIKDGDIIYFNNGDVGIGTTAPNGDLHIFDNDNAWLEIETDSTTKWAISELRAPGGVFQLSFLGSDASGDGAIIGNTANIDAIAANGLNIINEENSHIAFLTNGFGFSDEKMRISSEGNIGIGNSSPNEKLEVNGAIKVDDGGYSGITDGAITPVPAGGAGTIIFLSTHFYGWDGSAWQQLD
jgi:hypothetical protein